MRVQEDQQGKGSSKKTRTYVKHQKEDEATCSKYVNRFVSESESQKVVTQKILLSPRLMPRVIRNQGSL